MNGPNLEATLVELLDVSRFVVYHPNRSEERSPVTRPLPSGRLVHRIYGHTAARDQNTSYLSQGLSSVADVAQGHASTDDRIETVVLERQVLKTGLDKT